MYHFADLLVTHEEKKNKYTNHDLKIIIKSCFVMTISEMDHPKQPKVC